MYYDSDNDNDVYCEAKLGRSRSSKVVDFGTNREGVCDFLMVINSNLGSILPHFRDIAGFLHADNSDPSLFHPNFVGASLD